MIVIDNPADLPDEGTIDEIARALDARPDLYARRLLSASIMELATKRRGELVGPGVPDAKPGRL